MIEEMIAIICNKIQIYNKNYMRERERERERERDVESEFNNKSKFKWSVRL